MSADATLSQINKAPLGIIAGQGNLPRLLITHCQATSRPYSVILLEDNLDAETLDLAGENGQLLRIGAIGKALEFLRNNNATEIVLAGKITRPKISKILPDATGARLLAQLGASLFRGDNNLLSQIVKFLEGEGMRVVGAEEIVQDLLTPEGLIGKTRPDKQAQADIAFGAKIAVSIGELDIGQAVVVQKQHVLGVEALEGTEKLIARCAELQFDNAGAVLVKVKKPQQERRVDLPTIGPATIEQLARAGMAGVAIEAGGSLLINRQEVARLADLHGIFVIGFSI